MTPLVRTYLARAELILEKAGGEGPDCSTNWDKALHYGEEILIRTNGTAGAPDLYEARGEACYLKAKILWLKNEVHKGLPFAVEAAEYYAAESGDVARQREFLMWVVTAAGYRAQNRRTEAQQAYYKAFLIALRASHSGASAEQVLQETNSFFADDRGEGLKWFSDLALVCRSLGNDHVEVVCRLYSLVCSADLPGSRSGAELDQLLADFVAVAQRLDAHGDPYNAANAYYHAAFERYSQGVGRLSLSQRDEALSWLHKSSERAETSKSWGLKRVAESLSAGLLSMWMPEQDERDSERIMEHQQAAVTSAPSQLARARESLVLAYLSGRRLALDERWLEIGVSALQLYVQAWSEYVRPSEYALREWFGNDDVWVFRILAGQAAQCESRRRGARWQELVWGLEQGLKRPPFREQQARALSRGLFSDEALRRCQADLERTQVDVEEAIRDATAVSDRHHISQVHTCRDRLRAAQRSLQARLQWLATESVGDFPLPSSSPPVEIGDLQTRLCNDELYVGLLTAGNDKILSCRVTRHHFWVDVVESTRLEWTLHLAASEGISADRLPSEHRQLVISTANRLIGEVPHGVKTVLVSPDYLLANIPWHRAHSAYMTSVVLSSGMLVSSRSREQPDGVRPYIGIADDDGGTYGKVHEQVRRVSCRYFGGQGVCLTGSDSTALLTSHGRFALMHIACHATTGGLWLGGRYVTPVMLLDADVTADILLLTGCDVGQFGGDPRNEFAGVLSCLLAATNARAAVANYGPTEDPGAFVFSQLLVAALTGLPACSDLPAPANRLALGEAVLWARERLRHLPVTALSALVPEEKQEWGRAESWYEPWFVIGDPKATIDWDEEDTHDVDGKA